ncbi:MAG: GHKL domain-containing protein [Defluviitaleaceae bacterium]|nr:GHKL domain-containing protein [Defluviitaleaceae bacterium]
MFTVRWILGSVYDVFVFSIVFYNIFRFKFSKSELLVYTLCFMVVNFLSTIPMYLFPLYRDSYLTILTHIVSIIYLTIIGYRKNKIVTLAGFYAVLTVSISHIGNLLVTAIFASTGIMATFDFIFYRSEQSILIFALSVMAVSSIIISYYLGKRLDNKISALDNYTKEKCSNYLLVSSLIILFLLYYFNFFRWFVDAEILGIFFLITAGILISSLVFVISMFADSVKSALHAQEKEYYFTQCNLMQESIEQMKSIRHDIKMHLATINGYATKIDAYEIENYVSSLVENIDEIEIYSNTGNIAVDSIINYKLRNAKQEGIKIKTKLQIPSVLNVEAADLSIILGNLMDNALNAVSTLAENEEKKIKLDIEYSKEALVIHLNNSFDGIVKYNENTLVTRKDENHHGRGIKNIKKAVQKYNGYVDITHEDKMFSVAILLCVGSEKLS